MAAPQADTRLKYLLTALKNMKGNIDLAGFAEDLGLKRNNAYVSDSRYHLKTAIEKDGDLTVTSDLRVLAKSDGESAPTTPATPTSTPRKRGRPAKGTKEGSNASPKKLRTSKTQEENDPEILEEKDDSKEAEEGDE